MVALAFFTLLGLIAVVGGGWGLASVWKPRLAHYKLFGMAPRAVSARSRLIWGSSLVVIGVIFLVLSRGAPLTAS